MTTTNSPAQAEETVGTSIPPAAKLDSLLARLDLVAIVVTMAGLCMLTLTVAVLAVIQAARLIQSLWSDSLGRGLILVLCAGSLWVVARWKRSYLS